MIFFLILFLISACEANRTVATWECTSNTCDLECRISTKDLECWFIKDDVNVTDCGSPRCIIQCESEPYLQTADRCPLCEALCEEVPEECGDGTEVVCPVMEANWVCDLPDRCPTPKCEWVKHAPACACPEGDTVCSPSSPSQDSNLLWLIRSFLIVLIFWSF